MENSEGLKLLRAPFPPHTISKLPKPIKADAPKGRCPDCGGWHGLPAVHLDYVGHAALTDRLLDADPAWAWEPLAISPEGLPVLDPYGGMWIRLTVCGVTRLGYGHAGAKTGGDAIKEIIGTAQCGDAVGAALDLWHKGDLHSGKGEEPRTMPERELLDWTASIDGAGTVGELKRIKGEAEQAARGYGDAEALAAILRAAEAKAAKAKK